MLKLSVQFHIITGLEAKIDNQEKEVLNMHRGKSNNKILRIVKKVAIFFAFEIIFTAIVFPCYIFYGPFTKVRNIIVSTSMATMNHQYIAKTFLSKAKIDEILKFDAKANNPTTTTNTVIQQNINTIQTSKEDNSTEVIELQGKKFHGKAIIIHDPYKVKVGYSSQLLTIGETTSTIASRNNAIAAINGGGFYDISPDGKVGSGIGGVPIGIVMSEGNLIYPTKNVNLNEKMPCTMAINNEGHLIVGGPYSINDLMKMNVKEALSFSPTLVVNGTPYISETTVMGVNPRTAIGQRKNGDIIFLTIDGRQAFELGASLKDVQGVMLELKAENAMCLDGGSSTTMYYKDEIINKPSNMLGERSMPTIIYAEK